MSPSIFWGSVVNIRSIRIRIARFFMISLDVRFSFGLWFLRKDVTFFSKNFVILLTTFYAINDDDSGNIWQQQLLTHHQPKFNRLWYWFHMFMYFKLFLEAVNFIQSLAKAKQAYSLTCCQEYRNSLSSFSSTRVKIQTLKRTVTYKSHWACLNDFCCCFCCASNIEMNRVIQQFIKC